MSFAELRYSVSCEARHDELVAFLRARFVDVDAGLQGDSWIWIGDGGERVALDAFSTMRHQVKSRGPGPHVDEVPEWEPHEDGPAAEQAESMDEDLSAMTPWSPFAAIRVSFVTGSALSPAARFFLHSMGLLALVVVPPVGETVFPSVGTIRHDY